MTRASGYRADIDGLRAVAILPVLLFHAGVVGFSGGFVGVDIFFVISGYLITGIIAREMDEGRFSILAFYERRARRIMPALLPTIAVVLALAVWLYLPSDFPSVPRSAVAATWFVSNVRFFAETGYFQGGSETKPLLHTWSLAVEEQFYIGFPILLILVARYLPRWRKPVVLGIALFSFAIAWFTQAKGDGFAFYLLPPRAWELFAGALLALGAVPAVRVRAVREAVALTGLAMIAVAVFAYDRHTIFPGVTALLPVLGAAALIHCAPGTAAGRLLSTRPLVAVGLISYSLYLCHWPLIVFVEYAQDARLSGWQSAAVILAALAIATLSWRFVERPFRDRTRFGRWAIFASTGIGMALVSAAAVAMMAKGGWPERFPPEVARVAAGAGDVSPYRERCHDSDVSKGRPACTLGAEVPATSLLWGDSHGVELAYVLSQMEARHGRSLIQRTQSSCAPVLGYDPPNDPRCARVNAQVMAAIKADPRLRTIYLAAFWASPAYGGAEVTAGLDRTIGELLGMGRQVVLIGPIPSAGYDVPRRLAHLARAGALDEHIGSERAEVMPAEHRLRTIAARHQGRGLTYLSAVDRMCDARLCPVLRDGAPLYFDSHHVSVAGARTILGAPAG